jgi:hypothetical protein
MWIWVLLRNEKGWGRVVIFIDIFFFFSFVFPLPPFAPLKEVFGCLVVGTSNGIEKTKCNQVQQKLSGGGGNLYLHFFFLLPLSLVPLEELACDRCDGIEREHLTSIAKGEMVLLKRKEKNKLGYGEASGF